MSDDFEGSKILDLLAKLDTVPTIEVRTLFEAAYYRRHRDPKTAIGLCEKALTVLDRPPSGYNDLEGLTHTKGLCCLLIASIYLDQAEEDNLKLAKKYYDESQYTFHYYQWKHLESLAYLGLAITQRKSNDFQNAIEACKKAEDCLHYESIPTDINITILHEAIKKERSALQPYSTSEMLPPEIPAQPSRDRRKPLESTRYNLLAISELLIDAFTDVELRHLCYFEQDFRPVHNEFSQSMGKTELVQHIVEFSNNRLLIPKLLKVVKQRNPRQYARHKANRNKHVRNI